jgi:peptidoglycan-associated lipoprotein
MKRLVRPALWMPFVLPLALISCKRPAVIQPAGYSDAIPVPALPATESEAPDATERERLDRERAVSDRVSDNVRAVMREPIHFDFDRSDLSRETRFILDAIVQVMREDGSLRVRIEGHADERGSSEHNLALGQRRAAAARRYLVLRDVAADRIELATYGEEKPQCAQSAEWCWRLNRRAEFVLIP